MVTATASAPSASPSRATTASGGRPSPVLRVARAHPAASPPAPGPCAPHPLVPASAIDSDSTENRERTPSQRGSSREDISAAFEAHERGDAAHGHPRRTAALELRQPLVAHGIERAHRSVEVGHVPRRREHEVHHPRVAAARAGDGRPLADVAEPAGDAAAELRQELALARGHGRNAIGGVAALEVGQAPTGAHERCQERSHEPPGQDEERVQAAHATLQR